MAFRDNNPFRDDDEEEENFEVITPSEISQLKYQKQYYRNRMLDSSERSIRAIRESENLAVDTEVELARQGEALTRVEKNLDTMQGQLKQADRNVTSIKSIWGAIGNYFRKPLPESRSSHEAKPAADKTTNKDVRGESRTTNSRGTEDSSRHLYGAPKLVTRYDDDDDRMLNRNLDEISAGLSSLRQHALNFGDTIDTHNDQIERITTKTEQVDKKIDNTNKRIRTVLN